MAAVDALSPRRYEPDELLRLSKSPLVKKPDGLPPIEEWMGLAQTTARPPATRARTDGDVLSNVAEDGPRALTATRRPSFFESRLSNSKSSIPEDIVLGPPKMAFTSSSARTPSGHNDNPFSAGLSSPAFDDDRGDSPRFDRFRDTFGRNGRSDRDKDKDRVPDRSDLRGTMSKRGEGEGWTSVSARTPRKSFGAEEGDRFRRELRSDREKKDNPWDRDRPAKHEPLGRDRFRTKRDEPGWVLDEHRDRGDRDRDHHRDHHRGRVEKDPEWLDAGVDGKVGDSKGGSHSMEDFQRWKERMKAGNGSVDVKKKPEEPTPKPVPEDEPVEDGHKENIVKDEETAEGGISLSSVFEKSVESQSTTNQVENGVDRFFGFWSGSGVLKSPEQADIVNASRPEPKSAGKSRFTSFFQPQEPSQPPPSAPVKIPNTPKSPAYAPSPANESTNEDREGFQRILKMLGSASIGSDSPPTSIPTMNMSMSRSSQPSISPITSSISSPQGPPMHNRVNPSPARDPNADFFMRLIQQSQQNPPQQQHPHHHPLQQHQPPHPPPPPSSSSMSSHYGGPSQMPPPPPIDTSLHSFPRAKNGHPLSPPFDDPAVQAFRQRPNHDPSQFLSRPPPPMMDHHGPPPGWMQQAQPNPQPQQPQPQRQIAPPPGFQRGQAPHHQQGPPPPPPFLGPGPPPGVNGPLPFQLLSGGPLSGGPFTPNVPPPPHPSLFMGITGMNGMNNGPPPPPSFNQGVPLGYQNGPAFNHGGMNGAQFGHGGMNGPAFGHGG